MICDINNLPVCVGEQGRLDPFIPPSGCCPTSALATRAPLTQHLIACIPAQTLPLNQAPIQDLMKIISPLVRSGWAWRTVKRDLLHCRGIHWTRLHQIFCRGQRGTSVSNRTVWQSPILTPSRHARFISGYGGTSHLHSWPSNTTGSGGKSHDTRRRGNPWGDGSTRRHESLALTKRKER